MYAVLLVGVAVIGTVRTGLLEESPQETDLSSSAGRVGIQSRQRAAVVGARCGVPDCIRARCSRTRPVPARPSCIIIASIGGPNMVLRYTLTNHIATITLDRPQVMNALNRELYARLEEAFHQAHRDPDVRAVILTGEGKAFCSGDDEIGRASCRER